VGPHPHRGFAPVTIIFEGGVYHQDSMGNKSLVEKGGVQWMNSGKGIIHSERPSELLSKTGGVFEIIQFWVNTPAEHKFNPPDYQPLDINQIPEIIYDGGMAKASIIAGEYDGIKGKIKSFSELLILKLDISSGGKLGILIPEDFNSLIYQLDGKLVINNQEETKGKDLILLETDENDITIEGKEDTRAIVLAGKPLKEKVASYGPFVMNEQSEIYDAINDFKSGNMGRLTETFNFSSDKVNL